MSKRTIAFSSFVEAIKEQKARTKSKTNKKIVAWAKGKCMQIMLLQ